jgi:hypothetical protein
LIWENDDYNIGVFNSSSDVKFQLPSNIKEIIISIIKSICDTDTDRQKYYQISNSFIKKDYKIAELIIDAKGVINRHFLSKYDINLVINELLPIYNVDYRIIILFKRK